jgi:hypothetical protein
MPRLLVAHHYLTLAYVLQGDWTNAVVSARPANELGDSSWKYAGVGFVYAKAGLTAEATRIRDRLDEGGPQAVSPFYAAAVHAGLGRYDDAIRLLTRAVAERRWNLAWLGVDVYWDDMRVYPDFQRLQAQVLADSHVE